MLQNAKVKTFTASELLREFNVYVFKLTFFSWFLFAKCCLMTNEDVSLLQSFTKSNLKRGNLWVVYYLLELILFIFAISSTKVVAE